MVLASATLRADYRARLVGRTAGRLDRWGRFDDALDDEPDGGRFRCDGTV